MSEPPSRPVPDGTNASQVSSSPAGLSVVIPTSFFNFKKLSQELQDKIWSLVDVEPVSVTAVQKNQGRWNYDRKVPAILHACHDSRAEWKTDSSKPRRRNHPTYDVLNLHAQGEGRSVYFCFEYDTLAIRRDHINDFYRDNAFDTEIFDLDALIQVPDQHKLQHIVLSNDGSSFELIDTGSEEKFIDTAFAKPFPKVQSLTIVVLPQAADLWTWRDDKLGYTGCEIIRSLCSKMKVAFEKYKAGHPEWSAPTVISRDLGESVTTKRIREIMPDDSGDGERIYIRRRYIV